MFFLGGNDLGILFCIRVGPPLMWFTFIRFLLSIKKIDSLKVKYYFFMLEKFLNVMNF